MASGKKQRRARKLARKEQQPQTGPFRHKDGDRRRRGGTTYEEGLAAKRLMQQLGGPPTPGPQEGE
jgi:hypothetical protein